MLQLQVVMSEDFDEATQEFIVETRQLKLEHSLASLSKWESKFEKPFLDKNQKTEVEILTYVQMMDVEENTPPEIFLRLTQEDYLTINEYINAKMTATWFNKSDTPKKTQTQVVTSELIYYWLTSYEIPWDVEHWHLNRLFTLIEVFSAERAAMDKKKGGNKANTRSLAEQRRALNEARRAEHNTSG